jgi:hypothetical protein
MSPQRASILSSTILTFGLREGRAYRVTNAAPDAGAAPSAPAAEAPPAAKGRVKAKPAKAAEKSAPAP